MSPVIGFVGTGNMGTAIIRGLTGRGGLEFCGTDLNRDKLAELKRDCGLEPLATPNDVAERSDYIVLAVKPQHLRPVLQDMSGHLTEGKCLVSIAAGIPVARLREWSRDACPVVRVMPNTPALVGAGVSAVCLDDPRLSEAQKRQVQELFTAVGAVHVLPETLFDAFTAVIGSGPAYVFYFMEALVESAVNLGLPRAQATDMVLGLLTGSGKLAAEGGEHLSVLREMVTSPAGTTIRALVHMDRQAVRAAIIDAVEASYKRSIELGK
ncbi:pyrroline-5-carboxylate reductase [Desulfocurvibacter africanus PCS]|uniref:Pyrroline-5-carboxylate reductase n=1 Tax=Desulfocurvibacter africanus PCS TaxID=1262666 RepID=M5PRI8_DESAF|nr:pyrroline-5-carboxylate reductase [Desulfocurvibacter africanus]EMG36754.1 pyrroline-5-carboxylate reductase [Desulfocurvibacter africanus PCS]